MENITFEEFKKLDLRVGEIKAAEEIAGADKILKIRVDLGGEECELVAGVLSAASLLTACCWRLRTRIKPAYHCSSWRQTFPPARKYPRILHAEDLFH